MRRGCCWIRGGGGMSSRFDEAKIVMKCNVIMRTRE